MRYDEIRDEGVGRGRGEGEKKPSKVLMAQQVCPSPGTGGVPLHRGQREDVCMCVCVCVWVGTRVHVCVCGPYPLSYSTTHNDSHPFCCAQCHGCQSECLSANGNPCSLPINQ